MGARVVDHRYRLEALLGSGGGGEVWRARDTATGEVVALKLVPTERTGEAALHAEFEVASSLRHPNVVRVREYGFTEECQSYFTMDVVRGVNIVDHQIDLDLTTLYRTTTQICSALSYLHGRGLLHSDLKPSNILVVGQGADSQVQILDFGLARHRRATENRGGGTLGYMAPETVVGGRTDVRSELYSLGAVLYHVVTQRSPMGDSAEEFDRALRGEGLQPAAKLRPDLDPEWARLIDLLVAREPGSRPACAMEVQEIIDAWAESRGTERLGPPIRGADRPAPPIGGSLVGRARELEACADAASAAARGDGIMLFLQGESGVGKTRLLEEARGRAQLRRIRVVWASCAGDDAKPFRLAAQVVRTLEPGLTGAAVNRHDEVISVLCGAGAAGEGATPQDARLRILAGAAGLTVDAAESDPLVVIVDDVHRADRDAVDFIRALAFKLAGSRVSLVCAGRDEVLPMELAGDLEGESFLRTMRLERLDEATTRELVQAALGDVEADEMAAPADLSEGVFRASGGNPLLAEEVLRAWVDSGALIRARGAWVMRGDIIRRSQPQSLSVQEAVVARLDRLDRVPRRILVAASIIGDRFDADLVAQVANITLDRVEAALGDLVARRLLVPEGARGYRFAQTLVRELLYERTPIDGRARVHARALEILLERRARGEQVAQGELALHALRSRNVELGRGLVMDAAREAERASALDRAIEWYRGALTLDPDRATAFSLNEKIADLALVAGRADVALSHLQAAADCAPAETMARLRRKRAEAHLLGGDPRRARAEAEEACALGEVTSVERLELLEVSIRSTYRCGHLEDALLLCNIAAQLAASLGRLDLGATVERLRSAVLALKGDAQGAVAALRTAARQARRDGNEAEHAGALNNLSMSYSFLGRYGRALAAARSAARTMDRLGAVTLVARAQNNLGLAALYLGRWTDAEDALRAHGLASEMFGNRWGRVAALGNQSLLAACRGDLGRAAILAARSVSLAKKWGLKWPLANGLRHSAVVALAQSDLARARSQLAEARNVASSIDAGGLLLDIELVQAEAAIEAGELGAGRRICEGALRDAEQRQAQDVRRNLLVLLARVCRVEGDLQRASALISEARNGLAQAQTPLEYARAELERARILRAQGEVGAAEQVATAARKIFEELGAKADAAHADRVLRDLGEDPLTLRHSLKNLQILLDASRALGGVVDLPLVLEKVMDHVLAVSGAERGFLILLGDDGEHRFRVARNIDRETLDGSEFRVSRGLIDRVARTGKPISVTDVSDDVRFRSRRSVVELGLRSMMCVPLRAGGRVVGIIYIDSQRVADHFFQTDLAMLEALAAQAAVAIETARLYEDLKGKNELIGILAHELRTPLTAIMGFNELLKLGDSIPSGRRLEYAGTIGEQCARMNRMIQHVLDLSRLGSDRVRWRIADLAVGPLIADTASMLQPIATARRIEVVSEVPPGLPTVQVDRDRIVQVLTNLVSNAIAYSEPGTRVTVTATAAMLPGDRVGVEIRVSDQGPGIPSNEVGTVFEPFVRGSSSKNREGTGLGLHICQTIVKHHKGRIWVESKRGRGTTFVVQIPATEAPAPAAAG